MSLFYLRIKKDYHIHKEKKRGVKGNYKVVIDRDQDKGKRSDSELDRKKMTER